MQRGLSIIDAEGDEAEEEDDYSVSACAIIQRRNSSRKGRRRHNRRPSSPFSPDNFDGGVRRRSSAFTTSSGDTAISVEDGGSEEMIFEQLKLHKEVLSGVKTQPWPLRRKLKLVRQAKAYVRKHEGALQERLAQSHNTRDVLARVSILLNKKWQYFKREIANLQTSLVPWEHRIKAIESHFGSAVASYFTFLRWLFWINLVNSVTLTAFVAIPELLTADKKEAGERKIMLPDEEAKATHFLTLWEFEGVFKYSPFFYGWYTNKPTNRVYQLPLAYFITNLVVYTYSFVAILRKMAKNSRMSKLSEKEDECAFSWKLFTSWDFMIGNTETSHNRTASIVLGFKEALLEEAEKVKVQRNWKIITCRILVNTAVLILLTLSAYAVVEVVARSTESEANSTWWRQNETTVVMTLINAIFPIFFEILGILENYHPRKQLRLQLARIMVLNLLNQYSLIFAQFRKINDMKDDLKSLEPNKTIPKTCKYERMPCDNGMISNIIIAVTSMSLVTSPLQFGSQTKTPTWTTNFSGENEGFLSTPKTSFDFLKFEDLPPLSSTSYINEYENESSLLSTSFFYPKYENDSSRFDYNKDIGNPNEDYNYLGDIDITNETGKLPFNESFSFTTDLPLFEIENVTLEVTESSSEETDLITTLESENYNPSEIHEKNSFPNTTLLTTDVARNISYSHQTVEADSRSFITEKPDRNPEFHNICYKYFCQNDTTNDTTDETAIYTISLSLDTRRRLRQLCWETMFGQELAKLTVMDLVMTILSTLGMDFFRAVFVRFMNNCWCWDLEKQFPQYGDFKIAENILYLVNNQGLVWMGMFFSPGLITLNVIKLGILMYLRSWAVLSCNVPHEIVFRASRSNNFYLALLLTMLFLCVLPVGYAIVWVEPSWHCGPFSGYQRIYYLATRSLKEAVPKTIHKTLDYIASPGIVIPLIVLMALIIYYMVSLTGSLREANNDLKIQLRQERTEERRKMFKIAEKRQEVKDAPFSRWKKILPTSVPPSNVTEAAIAKDEIEVPETQQSELVNVQRIRGMSVTSDAGEGTEGEQESLPHDQHLIENQSRNESTRKLWQKIICTQ
ncbi:transmembrane channel-like protein 2 isoform X2 [Belonocnema kinseyi]|nr:transmembrane channel-like protein 2 isoform X2 [Belonocnema kinseyi]